MADTSRFSQTHGIVPVTVPLAANYNTETVANESIDMAKYGHVTLLFLFSADMAGNSGILTISAGLANAGTDAAATFTYRYGAAAVLVATADTLSAPVAAATLTLTTANCQSKVLVVEVDSEDMNVSGVQYRYLTPAYDDGGTGGIWSCVAILSEPRYEMGVMPTAI